VNDEITRNQDGIVEIFFSNPTINDVELTVDLLVTVPSGIHVYGEGFGRGGAAGAVVGDFEVPPGTSRTIFLNIKSEKIGTFPLHFSGQYWPGGNKDLYNPISLTHPFTVKEPSHDPLSSSLTNPQQIPGAAALATQAPTPAPQPNGGGGISCSAPASDSSGSVPVEMLLIGVGLVFVAGRRLWRR
jgi:hypothetical protein